MTDRKDAATARVKHLCIGPLASHIDGFAALLGSEGYALATVQQKCALLAGLCDSRYMSRPTLPRRQARVVPQRWPEAAHWW